MSVLIKGMKMPDGCDKCILSEIMSGENEPLILSCKVTDYITHETDWEELCPLVEIPTPHGRLIDADAFISFIEEHWDSYDQWVVQILEERPTIIEAGG